MFKGLAKKGNFRVLEIVKDAEFVWKDVKLKWKKTDWKNNNSGVKVVAKVLAMHIQCVYVMTVRKHRLNIITIVLFMVTFLTCCFKKTFLNFSLTVIFIIKNDKTLWKIKFLKTAYISINSSHFSLFVLFTKVTYREVTWKIITRLELQIRLIR